VIRPRHLEEPTVSTYHVSATSHWPNYLPEYVAVANGYFTDEGLDFSRDAPDDWTDVLRALADGSAHAVLGGLWVPAMYHGRGTDFVAFAQLNARNPKAILTREPQPDFQLSDLEGKLVLAPGAGGTAPYMHTAGLIRQAGVDLNSVRFIRDLSGATLTDLFVGGLGDAIVVDLVNAHLLEHRGIGSIAFRHADAGGSMPNSVYYTLPHLIGEPDSAPWRFTRAIQRATDWMNGHDGGDCSELLSRYWPKLPLEVLIESVDDLKRSGVWTDVLVDREGFDSWMSILAGEWLVDSSLTYEDVVDPRPAEAAIASVRGAHAGVQA
jgi:NitT/TauT family transport system substrate-binding protein